MWLPQKIPSTPLLLKDSEFSAIASFHPPDIRNHLLIDHVRIGKVIGGGEAQVPSIVLAGWDSAAAHAEHEKYNKEDGILGINHMGIPHKDVVTPPEVGGKDPGGESLSKGDQTVLGTEGQVLSRER